jgi:acyl dehydratase
VRFVGTVFAGDTLRASGVITAIRRVEGLTLIDCSVRLDVVYGANVLVGNATVHVDEAFQP